MNKRELEMKSPALKKRVKPRKESEQIKEEMRLRRMIDDEAFFNYEFNKLV